MKHLNLILLLIVLSSCGQNQKPASTDEAAQTIIASSNKDQNHLDYLGTYKGILPCADCEGIETIVTLNSNKSFSKTTKYQGKEDGKTFEEKGTFSFNQSTNIIILDGISDAPNQYLAGEGTLTQLDMEGNRIEGNLSQMYILKK